MIVSFADKQTQALFHRNRVKRLDASLQKTGLRKRRSIHRARTLTDLRALPGNRLEALKGDRQGQHSIRINDQWRICFRWSNGNAYDVELVDYH